MQNYYLSIHYKKCNIINLYQLNFPLIKLVNTPYLALDLDLPLLGLGTDYCPRL